MGTHVYVHVHVHVVIEHKNMYSTLRKTQHYTDSLALFSLSTTNLFIHAMHVCMYNTTRNFNFTF